MGKQRWRELGLTPRQLSKKAGVTYSMAEFITQSYRTPVQVNCCPTTACACSTQWKRKSTEKLLVCAVPPVSCSRKRGRSKGERNDCNEHTACSETPGKRSSSKDSCKSSSSAFCNTHCMQSCNIPPQKVKCLRKRQPNPGSKKAKCKTTEQCCSASPAPQPHKKKNQMIPINIRLDLPLNIFLDDEDCREIERGSQQCKKMKRTAVHVPCLLKESSTESSEEECQRPEQPSGLREEDCGDQEETSVEECDLNEDQSSSEEASCNQKTKAAEDCCPPSWREKIQDCVYFLEYLLNSLVNKC